MAQFFEGTRFNFAGKDNHPRRGVTMAVSPPELMGAVRLAVEDSRGAELKESDLIIELKFGGEKSQAAVFVVSHAVGDGARASVDVVLDHTQKSVVDFALPQESAVGSIRSLSELDRYAAPLVQRTVKWAGSVE